jgi:hypothetical protein
MGFENEDPCNAAPEITTRLRSICTLKRPDNSTIVTAIPDANTVDYDVPKFDGTRDYAGTSGKTYPDLTDTRPESAFLGPEAIFIGTGTIDLLAAAEGASTGSGSGQLALLFSTDAEVTADVLYTYRVPEPASMSLLGLGSLLLIRRKRKA